MNMHKQGLHLLAALVLIACGPVARDEGRLGQSEDPIVRATSAGGPDQVMLVVAQRVVGSNIVTTSCTGTLIGPRVVLTAAHCVQNAYANQIFVYWGDDFEADWTQVYHGSWYLVAPPLSDATSLWAHADGYTQHPTYDPNLHYPDIALVYLDRKTPYSPLALNHYQLGSWLYGKSVTFSGWGASQALTADLSQTIGGRVQRTGQAILLGPPTEADYHPDDPNAGMLIPEVRADQLKIDGSAPNSNGCAGDSGSPLLLAQSGGYVVAGVEYFGGLWCEDYSLFTRTYPFEGSYLNEGIQLGGLKPVPLSVNCIRKNADGSFRAYMGYEDKNRVSLDIPLGNRNQLRYDTLGLRPTHFVPGPHPFATVVDVPKYQTLVWQITPDNGWTTVTTANASSPTCTQAQSYSVACADSCVAQQLTGCSYYPDVPTCVDDCMSWEPYLEPCTQEYTLYLQCIGNSAPDAFLCDPDIGPYPLDCGAEEAALYACWGF